MDTNKKEAFTGGEWMARQGDMNEYEVFTNDMLIATVLAIDIPDEEGEANARLIAEAKNMYQLIQDILNDDKMNGILTHTERVEAKSIINRINK